MYSCIVLCMNFLTPEFGLMINALTPSSVFWSISAIVIVSLILLRKRYEMIVFILSLVSTVLIVLVLKFTFAIPRSIDALVKLDSYAFPSGHSASAMFLAIMFMWLYYRHSGQNIQRSVIVAIPLLVLALLVGYSRILIGVHTPVQVLAGFGVGILVPLCTIYLASKAKGPYF